MDDARQFDALIDDIYSASLTTADPTPLLGRIAAYVGYEILGLTTAQSRYSRPTCRACFGMDLAICQRAEEAFAVSLSVKDPDAGELATGQFAFRDEMISDADYHAQPYYDSVIAPHGLEHGLKLCLENSAERIIFANFARPRPDVDRAWQRRAVAALAPHWVRATQIYLKLEQVELLHRAYEDSTNLSPLPLVIYDNTRSLYFVNTRARLLAAGDGLTIARGGLQAGTDAENQRLRRAVAEAVAGSNASWGRSAGVDVAISRPSGKRPYHLVVVPLSPGRHCESRRPAAMVIVFDPEAEPSATLERCYELFGFTRAEAEVALGVMQGRSIEQIAAAMGNSVATVRNLLKRVFQKAGVNRQNELTRLMLHSALVVDPVPASAPPGPSTLDRRPAGARAVAQKPSTSCML